MRKRRFKQLGINYGEIICEAVETIGESLLQGLKFDSTIKCTITDASEADKGIYQVSNGSATFTAYSSEKYKVNTNVYVVIPQSDYDNEKIIVGKVAKKDEMLYNYVAPLDNMMAIKNDIVSENISAGLVANHPITTEKQLFTWSKGSGQSLSGFTRLGVSAEFQAWLLNYNCISGDYGLKLDVEFESPEILTNSQMVTTHRTLLLSVTDMIGNPYAFETFYLQEKMFDISDLGNITKITGSFYQTANSFKKDNDSLIPYYYKAPASKDKIDLPDNLFIRNIELSIGFDVRDQEGEFVQLYSFNGNAYNDNGAELTTNLRWLHVYGDDNKAPIEPEDLNAKDEKDAYKFSTNVEIRWYRYELGHASDGYGGVNWQCVEVEARQSVKDDIVAETYNFEFKFIPITTRSQEQIKAVILWNCVYKTDDKGDTTRESFESVYRSNIFTYYNTTDGYKDSIINSVNIQNNALSIHCYNNSNKNESENNYGNFLLYDEQNNLIDKGQSKILRYATFVLDLGENEIDQKDISSVKWRWPAQNTMLAAAGKAKEFIDASTENELDTYEWTQQGSNSTISFNDFTFIIGSHYSLDKGNNWIQCEVVYNEMTYVVTQELTFGQAGTQGATCTLVLDFDDDKVAFTVGDKDPRQVTLHIYDENNREISVTELNSNTNFSVEWDWLIGQDNVNFGLVYTDTNNNQLPKYKVSVQPIIIEEESQITIDSIYILKATLKGWKNSGSETEYDLTAFLPIPIRSSSSYSHISGADKIVYLSDGTPKCYTGIYELYQTLDDNLIITEEVTWQTNLQLSDNSTEAEKDQFYNSPTIKQITNTANNSTTTIGYRLQPASFYDKNIVEDTPFAVQAVVSDEVVWTQPILIIQNKYFSSVINQWDGKTVQIQAEEGNITAARIGAGRKNSSNQFSGVILGDWSSISNLKYSGTGLFGFKDGTMTFGFKDDGTAFIGKAGNGQINFDGDYGIIQSASNTGMSIDLQYGKIESKNFTLYAGTKGVEADYSLTLTTDSTQDPLKIGSNFSVDWTGKVTANSGTFKGTIEAGNGGTIGNWKITGGNLQSSSGLVTLYGDTGQISGSEIISGTLSSSTGTITLNGFLNIAGYGYLGYVTSLDGSGSSGIGLQWNNISGKGEVKATATNAGFYHSGSYMSASANGLSIGYDLGLSSSNRTSLISINGRLILENIFGFGDQHPSYYWGTGDGANAKKGQIYFQC